MRWTPLFLAGLLAPGLAAANAIPAAPAAAPSPEAAPFAGGEELSFELRLLGIKAGEADFSVEEDILDPQTYKLHARGRSVGTADSLFRLRQTATCVVEKSSLALRVCRVATQQRSGDRRREFVVVRDQKHVRERLLQDGKPREKVVDFGDGIERVQEALSGLYLLRSQFPDEGTPLRFQALRKGKPITVEARHAGTTTVDTPAGKFEAVEVQLSVVKGEAEEGESAGSLWFTADSRRIPLKLSVHAKVGKLEAILTRTKGTLAAAPRPAPTAMQASAPERKRAE